MTGPIGILDSGVGGLSILQAIEAELPNEDILYFADTAHFPYGEKTEAEVIRYSTQIAAFLFTQNVKLLIIGCHTASAAALKNLTNAFPLPVLGMIAPTINLLAQTTKNKRIGILATELTLRSGIYQNAIPGAITYPLSCPELKEKIESNDPNTQPTIQACIAPLLGQEVDTLLLACTHYPHLKGAIEEELDPCTVVLNPALSVAATAKDTLKDLQNKKHKPHHTFFVSGELSPFQTFLEKHPPKAPYEIRAEKFA
ncbi:MAG: glutamate racemase [Simkaniaceae bacterium]|nr:glutamate racemase [Candidatus Sacchlamyda saccharinae]